MSFVIASPELISAAATDLARIQNLISEANLAAALPTTSVLPAAQDEISAAISALFGNHAQQYQAIGEQASNLHSQFVHLIAAGAGSYASAEAVNASPL